MRRSTWQWRWWWGLAVLVVIFPLATRALDWDLTFEGQPADGEAASQGAGRIRTLKSESRIRLGVEHCFGTPGCAADNGRHVEGSARVFLQPAAPATLANIDYDLSNALDDGRVWIDTDGPDNVAGNGDDYTCNVYDAVAVAWKTCRDDGGALVAAIDLTGAAAGHELRYDGTKFVSVVPVIVATDSSTNAGAGSITNVDGAFPAADPLSAAVTTPATPASGLYIRAAASLSWTTGAANQTVVASLFENCGAAVRVRAKSVFVTTSGKTASTNLLFANTAPAASTTCTYTVNAVTDAGTATPNGAVAGITLDSSLVVELVTGAP